MNKIRSSSPAPEAALTPRELAAQERYEDLLRRYEALQDNMEALQVTQEDLLIMRTELEGERQRYQELFEFATDGYLVTDSRGIICEANSAACARLGLKPAYVAGKVLANYISLENRLSFRALLNDLEHGVDSAVWEGRLMPRHEGIRDAQLTATLTRDPQTGQPCALRWLLHDITHRRQLERARQADHERLLEQEHHAGVLEERTRIAQEFHDTLAQSFTGISFLLSAAETSVLDAPERAQAQITRARQVATQSIVEARQAIRAMRSETFNADGLAQAIAALVEQTTADTGIAIALTVKGRVCALPSQVTNDLLRIAQEGITNVLKHAHANEIWLCLHFETGQVRLHIEDDGCGFDPYASHPEAGFGLIGMRERALRIQGELQITGKAGAGTTIIVTVPVPESRNAQMPAA